MEERGLLVIERINMVDPTLEQNGRNSVFVFAINQSFVLMVLPL